MNNSYIWSSKTITCICLFSAVGAILAGSLAYYALIVMRVSMLLGSTLLTIAFVIMCFSVPMLATLTTLFNILEITTTADTVSFQVTPLFVLPYANSKPPFRRLKFTALWEDIILVKDTGERIIIYIEGELIVVPIYFHRMKRYSSLVRSKTVSATYLLTKMLYTSGQIIQLNNSIGAENLTKMITLDSEINEKKAMLLIKSIVAYSDIYGIFETQSPSINRMSVSSDVARKQIRTFSLLFLIGLAITISLLYIRPLA